MSYNLNKSDGSTLVVLADGLVDGSTTSIKFVGKNVVNYGEFQNENFLFLLENFAHNIPPNVPLAGQLWFDNTVNQLKLKLYDGSGWRQIPKVTVGTTATNQASGDFWYNTTGQQLYVNNGSGYSLIGPSSNAATSTKLQSSVNINGVSFDGSSNITITANTPNNHVPGVYLTGSNFNGSATTTWDVDVGTVTSSTALKVVARDSSGDIWYNVGHGSATASRYADLAEKYLSDKDYPAGTVMMVGGKYEVTACTLKGIAIGVVSTNPGYMMNSELEGGTYIALKGRVPVKVTGKITKGDTLIPGSNGCAIKGTGDCFAIALEDSNGGDVIEALIL